MNTVTTMIMFLVGLVVTLLGVGGVEASQNNYQAAGAVLVALGGLAIMGCGVLASQVSDYYDR